MNFKWISFKLSPVLLLSFSSSAGQLGESMTVPLEHLVVSLLS